MDYRLDDEQKLILETAQKFMHDEMPFEHRRKRVTEGRAVDREVWAKLAGMGWFGVGIPEDQGGYGGSAIETALISEAIGRGQLLDPFVMCGVLPTRILAALPQDQARPDLLEQVISGEVMLAVAHSEEQARACLCDVRVTARPNGDGWVLDGRKSLVVGAAECDRFVVSARTSGAARGEDGITLFLVDRNAPGVAVQGGRLVDWSSGADVVFDAVSVDAGDVIGQVGQGCDQLHPAVDEAIVALCAEAVGAVEGSIQITAAYIAERKQFDVALSSFQALQHRMSDMATELVMARSMVIRGLQALANATPTDRAALISGCKAMVTGNLKVATSQGIQLHGGYGITEEYAVGHFYKRLLVIDALFGRRAHHLARYAAWSATRDRA